MNEDFWVEAIGITLVVMIVVGSILSNKLEDKAKDKLTNLYKMLEKHDGFNVSRCLIKVTASIPVGIAIDEQSKQICLIKGELLRFITYSDIFESEVILGVDTITKTSRMSQLAGVAVGGLLLGGAGAVIGGLSGKTVASQNLKDVSLKLLINDTSNPVHVIDFTGVTAVKPTETKTKTALSETDYKSQWLEGIEEKQTFIGRTELKIALQEAQSWHDLISVIIKQAEQSFNALELKTCPYCAESIKKEAVLCRYCGKDV